MSYWRNTLENIRSYRIYSSTDVTFAALEALREILRRSKSIDNALKEVADFVLSLVNVRPTSLMLSNAMRRVLAKLESKVRDGAKLEEVCNILEEEISAFKREVEESINLVATLSARRIKNEDTILTCSYSKTVKRMFEVVKEEGKDVQVIVTESRPGGEGVKMARELGELGFPTELIVDSAVRFFMREVDKVVVGAEAIAANGAVVNKVGTSLIALAAHEARVRMFVLATTHKFSPETVLGELVRLPILHDVSLLPGLERANELTVEVPLFDVTPPEYVDIIVTERGVVAPEAVILLVKELYGWPPAPADLESIARELLKAR